MQFDIRRFDIYRKVPKDLTQPTLTGAVISLSCIFFMTVLLLNEFIAFVTTDISSELFVDDPVRETDRIPVTLDITLHKMECEYIGLDIQDDTGRHEVGHIQDTAKDSLPDGGCRFKAKFEVLKVPGNFHVSTHSATSQPNDPDMQHTIHKVTFGIIDDEVKMDRIDVPGSFNPLQNVHKGTDDALSTHDYRMKIVPTIYESINTEKLFPYQYTFQYRSFLSYSPTGHFHMPAIWFRYDVSPITVKYHEKRKPLYSFLTSLCAIIGGTFTVAGIIDSLVFTASEMWKKFELGKLS